MPEIKCRENDIVLSSVNYVPVAWRNYYHRAEQGEILDYVIIMAYPEHDGVDGEAGPECSITYLEESTVNILKEVSWNELNEQNLVFGKVIVIDGKKYILRLLTGSNDKQELRVNEWDKYIVNVDNLVGLPVSADYETDYNLKDDQENDNLWHWYNFASYTQSECSKGKKSCATRGFSFVEDSSESDKDLKYETIGYRPVLELLE